MVSFAIDLKQGN